MQRNIKKLILLVVCSMCLAEPSVYNVGIGIADVTGPAADINMVSFFVVVF